jgi:hypothetical protein
VRGQIYFKCRGSCALLLTCHPILAGNILTVADDLLKNDGQKFLEMMEQLAERRMQREQQAAQDLEEDSDADDDDEGDEDDEEDDDEDDDEEEDEEEEVCPGHFLFIV